MFKAISEISRNSVVNPSKNSLSVFFYKTLLPQIAIFKLKYSMQYNPKIKSFDTDILRNDSRKTLKIFVFHN